MKNLLFLLILQLLLFSGVSAQDGNIRLSLDDALELAREQSLQAFLNQHYYMSDYWAYRSYRADYLPSVSLQANPLSYSNASNLRYNSNTQTDEYIRTENLSSNLQMNISQKLAATGGTFFLESELGRIENFGNNSYQQYSSVPFRLRYQQKIFGFNPMKWQRKIEPLKFGKAKKEYLQSVEKMHINTISHFFNLIRESISLEMAQTNMENTKNLLKTAQRRFELGTVSREELLELRLSENNAKIDQQEAKLNYREANESLLNFLMLPVETELDIKIPEDIPVTAVDVKQVLQSALDNNPELLQLKQQIIENERNVDQAKAERHFSADINVSYGISKDDGNLNQNGNLSDVYQPNFENHQMVSVSLTIPILDWGRKKGQYKMAKSQKQIAEISARKTLQQFEQNAVTRAIAFNIQKSKVESAALSDTLAAESYELTMKRFRTGKADVLRLTTSQKAKDNATLQYINALSDYWNYYFTLRQLTLFDFENNSNIEFNEEEILYQ